MLCNSNQALLRFAAVLAPMLTAKSAGGQPADITTNDFDQAYSRLKRTIRTAQSDGFPAAVRRQLVKTRLALANTGEDGAIRIVGELRAMNRSEREAAGPKSEWLSERTLEIASSNAPLKFELFKILAEMYPRLSDESRRSVLSALVDSYTPATAADTHGGRAYRD